MADPLLTPPPVRVTIFGRTGSANAYAIRDFLYRSDVPFEWVEIKDDEQARQLGPAERP